MSKHNSKACNASHILLYFEGQQPFFWQLSAEAILITTQNAPGCYHGHKLTTRDVSLFLNMPCHVCYSSVHNNHTPVECFQQLWLPHPIHIQPNMLEPKHLPWMHSDQNATYTLACKNQKDLTSLDLIRHQKIRVPRLLYNVLYDIVRVILCVSVLVNSWHVTDGRTHNHNIYCASIALCSKNNQQPPLPTPLPWGVRWWMKKGWGLTNANANG